MREVIEEALQALVGQPLLLTRRAADMEMFHFGVRHIVRDSKGNESVIGTYALHVQCAWRIVGPLGIVTGRHDLYYPAGDPDRDEPGFDWQVPGSNRRDARMASFMIQWQAPLVVVAVQADAVGSVYLTLSQGFALEVWPDDSLAGEHWRLLALSQAGPSRHFVVSGIGVDDQDWVARAGD
jgi:hypothetical protein